MERFSPTLNESANQLPNNLSMHTIQFGFHPSKKVLKSSKHQATLKKYGKAALKAKPQWRESGNQSSMSQISVKTAYEKEKPINIEFVRPLPPIDSLSSGKRLQKSESAAMYLSYTTLSNLNKSKSQLNESQASMRPKVPFALAQSETKVETSQLQSKEREGNLGINKKDLNRTMDGKLHFFITN